MELGWIVNPDHMSQAAVDDTLTLLESERYSGVISPHGWVDPGNWPRLWKLGGMAFPGHSAHRRLRQGVEEATARARRRSRSAGATAPTSAASRTSPTSRRRARSRYPFKSYDGKVTFDRQKTGERTFDFAKEGVAHYGLYADWFEDLRRVGGQQLADDMWARRRGVPADVGARERHRVQALLLPPGRHEAPRPRADPPRRRLAARCSSAPASRSSATARGAGA